MCHSHHFYAHANPVLFTEFIKEYLGDLKYEALKSRATAIKQWKLDEMESYLQMLKSAHKTIQTEELLATLKTVR
jgi:hypothetical protein